MEKILFKANGQSLVKTGGLSTYASDVVEYVEAEFTLGDDWLEYDSARAIWQNGDIRVACALNHGKCKVPFEVLAQKGPVTVNLIASSAESDVLAGRITTYPIKAFTVTVKVNLDGTDPQTITPTQFEQFVEAVHDDAEKAKTEADRSSSEADRAESEAEHALASAQASEASAIRSSNYANDAKTYADNASDSADASASSATASANSASASAQSASDSADSASASATSAREAEEAKQTILTMRAVARSLPEGSQPTASLVNGLLTLGIPKGDKGDTGNGIDHVQLNADYTLTIFFTDGTQTQTTSIRGEKGETGAVPNFSIGEVTTLDEHEQATASIGGTAEAPVLNLKIPQGKTGEVTLEDLESLLPKDTASGDIISIPDGQSIIPVESLKVTLEPIQDLHGYDKPWAEGAGANIWGGLKMAQDINEAIPNESSIDTVNKTISIIAAASMSSVVIIDGIFNENTRYTFIGKGSGAERFNIKFQYSDGTNSATFIDGAYTSADGKTVSAIIAWQYTGTSVLKYEECGLFEGVKTVADFTPYSNICPIDGWTAADTHMAGKNLLDGVWESGVINTSTGKNQAGSISIRTKNYIPVAGGQAYYVSWEQPTSLYMLFFSYKKDGSFSRYLGARNTNPSYMTLNDDEVFIRFYTYNNTVEPTDMQLELGSATAYAPYDGKTIHTEIEGNYTVTSTDNVPYLLKEVGDIDGDRLREKIVGGTVAWNQTAKELNSTNWAREANTVTVTFSDGVATISGPANYGINQIGGQISVSASHKYLLSYQVKGSAGQAERMLIASRLVAEHTIASANTWERVEKIATSSTDAKGYIYLFGVGSAYTDLSFRNTILIDLTAMLGSTIADYIYSLEQANAGAGVAWFKEHFAPNDYYPYDAGSLKSVQTTAHVTKDADGNVLGNYPLDSSKTLQGIFKLDANNNLYADGDIYYPSEGIDRKYGIVDLGTLNWIAGNRNTDNTGRVFYVSNFYPLGVRNNNAICNKLINSAVFNNTWGSLKANEFAIYSKNLIACADYADAASFKTAMSGVMLVYEKATPTTEEAEPFAEIQKVISGGTEEYIDDREVPIPVGHETEYLSRETYGCTIDIVTGECVIDRAIREFDGSSDEVWGVNSATNGYAFNIPNLAENKIPQTPLSNSFVGVSPRAYGNLLDGECAVTTSPHNYTNFLTNVATTVEEWRAYLASNPLQVVYELAEPLSIQLTPEEIHLLLGYNTIWSDGKVELEYSADVTKWLMKKLNS